MPEFKSKKKFIKKQKVKLTDNLTTSKNDLKLVNSAINKRWNISPEIKSKLIEKLQTTINHEDDEIALKAIKIYTDMEKQNQVDDIDNKKYERIDNDKPTEKIVVKLNFDDRK